MAFYVPQLAARTRRRRPRPRSDAKHDLGALS